MDYVYCHKDLDICYRNWHMVLFFRCCKEGEGLAWRNEYPFSWENPVRVCDHGIQCHYCLHCSAKALGNVCQDISCLNNVGHPCTTRVKDQDCQINSGLQNCQECTDQDMNCNFRPQLCRMSNSDRHPFCVVYLWNMPDHRLCMIGTITSPLVRSISSFIINLWKGE